MTIAPGNGVKITKQVFTDLDDDLDSIRIKVLDEALSSQYDRNPTSKTLTKVQSIAIRHLCRINPEYRKLKKAQKQAIGKNLSAYWQNNYRAKVADKWHQKLPVIYRNYVPKATIDSLEKEFNISSGDDDNYVVQLVYNGKVIKSKSMSHLEVITRFF